MFGAVANGNERGRRNRAVQELREAEVTADELPRLVQAYGLKFDAPMTDVAVSKRVGELRHFLATGPPQSRKAKQAAIEDWEWRQGL